MASRAQLASATASVRQLQQDKSLLEAANVRLTEAMERVSERLQQEEQQRQQRQWERPTSRGGAAKGMAGAVATVAPLGADERAVLVGEAAALSAELSRTRNVLEKM